MAAPPLAAAAAAVPPLAPLPSHVPLREWEALLGGRLPSDTIGVAGSTPPAASAAPPPVSVSKAALDRLVMNWLLVEGYQQVAEQFQQEAGVKAPVPLSSITARTHIRSSLSRGCISHALSQIESLVPDLLPRHPSLLVALHQQALVELIRAGQVDEALQYARTHLRSACASDPALLRAMEETLSLLAFAALPPAANPARHLLEQRQRTRLGDSVNQHILQAQFAVKESKLSILIKHLQQAQETLKHFVPHFPMLDCSAAMSDTAADKTMPASSAAGAASQRDSALPSLLDPAAFFESLGAREEAERASETRRLEEEARRIRMAEEEVRRVRADREATRRARQRLAAALAADPRLAAPGASGEEDEEEAVAHYYESESGEEMEEGEDEEEGEDDEEGEEEEDEEEQHMELH